jgi:hypothetical protein
VKVLKPVTDNSIENEHILSQSYEITNFMTSRVLYQKTKLRRYENGCLGAHLMCPVNAYGRE